MADPLPLDSSHPASPAESNGSSAHDHSRELKAPKDRNCPFCGQAFTSSSLGRHLDLYIKPKNPKPSDGVHDVEEIRRIRGGITRRQPRTNLGVKTVEDGSTQGQEGGRTWGSRQQGEHESVVGKATEKVRYTDRAYVNSPVDKEAGMQTYFNAPNWQATGVINDLPARGPSRSHNATPTGGAQSQRMQEMRRDNTGSRIERPELVADDMWKLQEQAEIGKAAEMALREVLGSLEAARKKVEPQAMYEDFDFMSLSFPGLCLQILPPPPSLFSADPYAQPHTWALVPPGEDQRRAVTRMVNERFTWIRNGRRENMPDSVVFKHHVHLTSAYEHYETFSQEEKQRIWTVELSRALVGERGRKTDLKKELDNARQRIQHLETEYDRLSRCQLPREYLLNPPKTMPIPSTVLREMPASHSKSAAAEANYDIETLLDKWKGVVKSTARPPRHGAQTSVQSYPPTDFLTEKVRNPMKGDIVMNGSIFAIGGPMERDAPGTHDIGSEIHRERYEYETPQVPGTVMDADDDAGEGDAEGEVDDREGYGNDRALTRRRNNVDPGEYCAPVNGMLNVNGKRPVDPGDESPNNVVYGKRGTGRVYKERA